MAEELPQRGTIEAKDPFSMAPPGYGLTSDNERWPWGKPQEDVDPEAVLRKAVDSLEVPHVREEMMKLLMVGASVEALVEKSVPVKKNVLTSFGTPPLCLLLVITSITPM